ncbi:MAG: glycosyl hydrolase [Burkholderiales bacterium RIFCSPLOWO2_02_FULL_57_36]|nr:MAG: glycosyl hydrolase [Burkholderiales bacterium RIFCSPLOWO2_02_FULL_57_36]
MGFSATQNAIYSSGHPAQGSGLVNPFGLIKSTDGGQTWQKLGMEGESDFHILGTGYETGAIYVVSANSNSKMKKPGIYFTVNDGFSWQRATAKGLENYPRSLAVHPSDPKAVAAGAEKGLYLSRDAGETFQKIADGEIAGTFFDLNGQHLWFSTANGQPALRRFDLDGKQVDNVVLPAMENDAVAYITQNPVKRNEYAIATYQRSVYISPDEGKSWKQIADKGQSL